MTWKRQFDIDETLDKAMTVFWTRGFEATSVQELVDNMGVNRASIYGTYGDKRALFRAALERYDTEVRQKKLRMFEALAPAEGIRKFFESFIIEAREQDPVRGCFMTNTALELSPHDDEIRKIVERAQTGIKTFFTYMVRRGQENGEFSTDIAPEAAGKLLLNDMLGLVVLCKSRDDEDMLYGIIDEVIARLR